VWPRPRLVLVLRSCPRARCSLLLWVWLVLPLVWVLCCFDQCTSCCLPYLALTCIDHDTHPYSITNPDTCRAHVHDSCLVSSGHLPSHGYSRLDTSAPTPTGTSFTRVSASPNHFKLLCRLLHSIPGVLISLSSHACCVADATSSIVATTLHTRARITHTQLNHTPLRFPCRLF
jgi:hypothetical protein